MVPSFGGPCLHWIFGGGDPDAFGRAFGPIIYSEPTVSTEAKSYYSLSETQMQFKFPPPSGDTEAERAKYFGEESIPQDRSATRGIKFPRATAGGGKLRRM